MVVDKQRKTEGAFGVPFSLRVQLAFLQPRYGGESWGGLESPTMGICDHGE